MKIQFLFQIELAKYTAHWQCPESMPEPNTQDQCTHTGTSLGFLFDDPLTATPGLERYQTCHVQVDVQPSNKDECC